MFSRVNAGERLPFHCVMKFPTLTTGGQEKLVEHFWQCCKCISAPTPEGQDASKLFHNHYIEPWQQWHLVGEVHEQPIPEWLKGAQSNITKWDPVPTTIIYDRFVIDRTVLTGEHYYGPPRPEMMEKTDRCTADTRINFPNGIKHPLIGHVHTKCDNCKEYARVWYLTKRGINRVNEPVAARMPLEDARKFTKKRQGWICGEGKLRFAIQEMRNDYIEPLGPDERREAVKILLDGKNTPYWPRRKLVDGTTKQIDVVEGMQAYRNVPRWAFRK